MASIEQITGQTSRDWVSFLPTVISAFNEQTREKALKMGKPPKDPRRTRLLQMNQRLHPGRQQHHHQRRQSYDQ
jgi:hypothetical protein